MRHLRLRIFKITLLISSIISLQVLFSDRLAALFNSKVLEPSCASRARCARSGTNGQVWVISLRKLDKSFTVLRMVIFLMCQLWHYELLRVKLFYFDFPYKQLSQLCCRSKFILFWFPIQLSSLLSFYSRHCLLLEFYFRVSSVFEKEYFLNNVTKFSSGFTILLKFLNILLHI